MKLTEKSGALTSLQVKKLKEPSELAHDRFKDLGFAPKTQISLGIGPVSSKSMSQSDQSFCCVVNWEPKLRAFSLFYAGSEH